MPDCPVGYQLCRYPDTNNIFYPTNIRMSSFMVLIVGMAGSYVENMGYNFKRLGSTEIAFCIVEKLANKRLTSKLPRELPRGF